MPNLKRKYKIIKQTNENIWGNYDKITKLNRKKWRFFPKSVVNNYVKKKKSTNKVKNKVFYKKKDTLKSKNNSLKTIYKRRLVNKQKFKSFYGNIPYKKLKKKFTKIEKKSKINLINNLIVSLESRLDVFLFRLGFFPSIFHAKQVINHKHIIVNNNVVSHGNYQLKAGDFIRYNGSLENLKLVNVPYSCINKKMGLVLFMRSPVITEIKYPFTGNLKFLFEYLNKK